MRHLNIFASVFSLTVLGMVGMTSCEESEIFQVDSPDWRSSRIKAIADSAGNVEAPLYTIGATDFSTGWWAKFSHYYQIPEGQTWDAEFDLYINPDATNTYKNFALIITNDVNRSATGYAEYGAIRYDYQPSGNSEWGDYIDRSLVTSNLEFSTDTDKGVDKLGGRVHLTVDRSAGGLVVTMDNGTVKKVYNQTDALVNLNPNATNTKIRCFLVPEGSYINFMKTNIVSIEDAPDSDPASIELKGVPDQIILGSNLTESLASVTGTVTFESGVATSISVSDLQLELANATEYGTTTLIALYNKTSKGNVSSKSVVATAEVELVDKISETATFMAYPTPIVLGLEDNSTPWWTYFTDNIQVDRRQTAVVSFTNYSNCINNWNNFCIILNKQDIGTEYAVLRADNYGWGDGYSSCTTSGGQTNWDDWRNAMNGAKVTVKITNVGNGTANVECTMIGNNGVTYVQDYKGITISDRDDFCFRFVCEGSHLVFNTPEDMFVNVHPQPTVLGAEDNSTGFWGALTDPIAVDPFFTATVDFTNYTNGANNWNNWLIVLDNKDLSTEYAVVRADNYGWGGGYDNNDQLDKGPGQSDWATWLAAMNGAKCHAEITNVGDGTADIIVEMNGTDGETYYQYYNNILIGDPNDFAFRFTVDGCHLVFE